MEFEPAEEGKVGGEGERFLLRCESIVNIFKSQSLKHIGVR